MAAPMQRLQDEFALWHASGRKAELWIRDDDAIEVSPELTRLQRVLEQFDVPCGLAVIPGHLKPELPALIATSKAFVPMCHGWKHTNYNKGTNPSEFGKDRAIDAARADAVSARRVFGAHFPTAPVFFVPPYNRLSASVQRALPDLGFDGLSSRPDYIERKMVRLLRAWPALPAVRVAPRRSFPRIDVQVDLIDWAAKSAVTDEGVVNALTIQLQMRRRGFLPVSEPIGLLTHHLVHDEKIWSLLERLIEVTKSNPAVDFFDLEAYFGARCSGGEHLEAH